MAEQFSINQFIMQFLELRLDDLIFTLLLGGLGFIIFLLILGIAPPIKQIKMWK